MTDVVLKRHLEEMAAFLRTFDLEESYVAGKIRRTGEFWQGPTMDVGELWMNFVMYYYDRAVEKPWSINIRVVADDHTSLAGAHRAGSQEELLEFLESPEAVEKLKARIMNLAKDEAGFYWP